MKLEAVVIVVESTMTGVVKNEQVVRVVELLDKLYDLVFKKHLRSARAVMTKFANTDAVVEAILKYLFELGYFVFYLFLVLIDLSVPFDQHYPNFAVARWKA